MHDIKTKQTHKDIKAFDKTADLSRHLQNTYVRTKEQTEHPEQGGYVTEAEDKVQEGAKAVGKTAFRVAGSAGKKTIRKIRSSRLSSKGAETSANTEESGSEEQGENRAKDKTTSIGPTEKKTITASKEQPVSTAKPAASNLITPNPKPAAETVSRPLVNAPQTVQSTEKAGKGTIKTMPRTIKTASQTAERTIKATGKAAKSTVKATQHTAQAAKKAQQAAKTAKASARFSVKVAKLTVKAAAAIVKGILALVGIGGPGIVIIVIIIAAAALIASPLGILFSGDNTDSGVQSISSVVQRVETEFNQKISDIEQNNPYDSVNIQYVGSADNTRIDNWPDVLAVFAVKTATNSHNPMDVATIDAKRAGLLEDVFWDMNRIEYHVEMASSSASSSNESSTGSFASLQAAAQRVLTITVTSKTADQQADDYGLTADQKSIVDQLLSGDCREMLLELLGQSSKN